MKKHNLLPVLLFILLNPGFQLHVTAQCNPNPCTVPTPSVNAQDACVLPDPWAFNCYYGATTFDAPVSFPPSWCTTIENNHFFGFTADAPEATFEICTYACSSGSGIQAAVLSSFDCINFSFVSPCLGNITYGTCQTLVASNLTPGEVYYLMIDGNAGAICDYTINGADPTIFGQPDGLCLPNAAATYSTQTVSTWSIDPPTAGAIQGNPVSNTVNIIWAESGPAKVCATSLICPDAPEFCLNVLIGENVTSSQTVQLCENHTVDCAGQTFANAGNYTVILPAASGCDSTVNCMITVIPTINTNQNAQMCQGGSAFCAGEEFFAPGNYPVTLPSWLGCDSVVHCLINVVPTVIVQLDPKYICEGSCFQLGDSMYCNPGNYTRVFQSSLGCDSIINFNVIVIPFNTTADIQAPQGQTITCAHPTLPIQSSNNPAATHIWKNFVGDTLGQGNAITVGTPGLYTHETKVTIGGASCIDQAKILIKQNNMPPPVTASGGTIDAAHPTVQLMGHSIISGVTYHWTGPNGFSSNLKKPIVSVPGFYTLTVTNPQTGCSNSITVEVTVMN